MTIEGYKALPEKDLRAKLAELNAENFKKRFTSEAMTPQKGAEIRARRREIARINSVFGARAALARRTEEAKKLEVQLAALGKPHEGDVAQKHRRSLAAGRLAGAKRAIRELNTATTEKAKAKKK